MAGIYIHIPFCQSRCIYCGFYSTTALDQRQRYVDAVCKEWLLRSGKNNEEDGTNNECIGTIYLGGGTPSQLTDSQLRQLFNTLPSTNGEVTIEVNPDDISVPYVEMLSKLPVNRISVGVQTFADQRLHFLHRRHTAKQVTQAISLLRDAGFRNISVDLMYGFPHETMDDWQYDIDHALALRVEHISAYCLMVEEGTPLQRMGIKPCDEELERQMYYTLIDRLSEDGYEHYEISNFAKPGYRSRHNSSYWNDIPYIGLGAAAHSYQKATKGNGPLMYRSWNVSDIRQYMESIEQGTLPSEREVLDENTRYNDRVATALRTSDGLDLSALSDRQRRYCEQEATPFLKDGLLRQEGNCLILTREGLFVSDMVMSSLILV